MRSEAVRSRGSCGSATVRLCTQHRAEMLLLPPTYQLMSTPGEKPARTQRRHAATHPSHTHTRTQAHTHLHTGTNNQQFTLRDLPLPLRFLLFFSRFGFSFFFPSLSFLGSITWCASSTLPGPSPLLSSAAEQEARLEGSWGVVGGSWGLVGADQ